jgi:lipopolysaccharide/colanic/teichoic acid biosynthesis glycosyltransferase
MAKTNFIEKLRHGDCKIIAELTGYAVSTVWMQLHGQRTLKDEVVKAALRVIKNRELLFKNNTIINTLIKVVHQADSVL